MERRVKNNRYKNGGNSKQDWISHKIGLLIKEGYPKDQAVAVSYSMYDQEHKQSGGYQKTGNTNLDSQDIANVQNMTGLQFTPEFVDSYFSKDVNTTSPTMTSPQTQNVINDFAKMPVKDITSDGLFTDRKVWYTDRAENFLGKSPAIEGKDYQRIPYSQWKAYQTSPAYLQYQNTPPNNGEMTTMQIGGNFNPPENIGYAPQPINLQSPTNLFNTGNYDQYTQSLQQQYPLPNAKISGFPSNLNEFSPPPITTPNTYNVDPSSIYIQGDNNGDGVVDERDQIDMYGNPLSSNNIQNTNTTENFSYFNPYGGFDIPSAAYKLGQGIESGNAFDIGVSGLKLATGLGRNLVSGMGTANRRQNILQDFQQKARQASRPVSQSLQVGGYFQDGGQQSTPSPEEIVTAYAQTIGQDPQAIIEQLQQLPPDQQEQALAEMLSALQQPSQEQPSFKDGGRLKKKEENKIATGEYVAEVPEGEKVAEVEVDEWIKKPDETIQKVLGATHEQGGVELTSEQLPNDSKIISDHLKIGKEGAKKFNDEYDLGLKSTNTYADVIDKFNRKTGLDKIVKEQEDLAAKLQKQADKLLHNPNLEQTIKMNIDFLTEEFQELEQEKLPIIETRKLFFDEVFNLQEKSKIGHNKEEVVFQDGGLYNGDMIIGYSKKYNLPEDRVKELLNEFKKGGLQQYQTAGRVNVVSNLNPYSKNVRDKQSANEEAYGIVRTQEALQNLYNNFPNIINSDPGFKQLITVDTKGNVKLKENLPLNKQSNIVENVQRLIDENMKDSAQTIINNPDNFSPEAVAEAQRYANEETFIADTTGETDQSRAIRGYDAKLGDFTAGRYSMQMNLVTPEEKQLLRDNGILTVKQLKDSPLRSKLSAPSIKNLENVESLISDSAADYGIAEVTPTDKPLATTTSPTNKLPQFTGNNEEINTYGLLNLPDQTPLMPDSLQGALKINRRYDRIEAPLVSPDAQVTEIRRQEAATIESLNSLPDAQRAAAIAQVQANTQANLNNVMGQVAGQNQASVFSANNANAQIQAREEDARATDLQNYENKILKADSITQQNLRNYYNTTQRVNLGNYNTVNSVNLVNSMYDNARYTPEGVQMTNLDSAPNYGTLISDQYQQLVDAEKRKNQFKLDVKPKKKRFGGAQRD